MKVRKHPFSGRQRWLCLLIALAASLRGVKLMANPQGMTVVSGSATAQTTGSQLSITTGNLTVLNWNSFNIQSGETTSFLQPSGSSVVFNYIGDHNPSQIWGNLTANGTVILANANGFYFGPNSMVKVGGNFVATTTPLPPDLGPGASWQFNGAPPLAKIINHGQISVGDGHSLFLISEQIENHGTLSAPGGEVDLAAGQTVLVSERPDGRGLAAKVTLPAGSVSNDGSIIANAGNIALRAQVVNQDGILQADSVRGENGDIVLAAGDAVNLGAASQILARGDSSPGGSAGGVITVLAGNTFSDATGSRVSAAGGSQGGNGGSIEISAPNVESLNSSLDASAQAGWDGGVFSLDPANLTLGTSSAGGAININSAFNGFSSINLQASGNITLNPNTLWNLSGSTGNNAGHLTLSAGGNIVFGSKSQIFDANDWSVTLSAGVNLSSGQVQSGVGSIQIGTGDIQLAQGSIALSAGQDITVGTGFVNTFGGGSIAATALAGSINAGVNNAGYTFGVGSAGVENSGYGYYVGGAFNGEPQVGGISTVAGGDVKLVAGQNVISVPTVPLHTSPGASGAYGKEPGNVTVIAGNDILGNYLVRNGNGLLESGVSVNNGQVTIVNPSADIGAPATATSPISAVSLSLMSGQWSAYAANDLFISEVRNPNGVFNPNKIPVPAGIYSGNENSLGNLVPVPATQTYLSDYSPTAGASFWAGDAITLGSGVIPRNSVQAPNVSLYPPSLSLTAGAGGITVDNQIFLFPSSQGTLNIQDAGNLAGIFVPFSTGGTGGAVTGIAMSDSGLPDWTAIVDGAHAATPLHLNDARPVVLNIGGDIDTFTLSLPTFAEITVGGNTLNFNFTGQNVAVTEKTTLQVTGSIKYQGAVSSEPFADMLPADLLNVAASTDPAAIANLLYDATSQTLSYGGIMSADDEAFLLNPTVYVLNSQGKPVLNTSGQPEVVPVAFSSTQVKNDYQTAVAALYAASQKASFADSVGLNLNGPGAFDIKAKSMDLGASGGINLNDVPVPSLTAQTPDGADLDISLAGSLEMTTSKISNSGLLGSIQIGEAASPVLGSIDLGLQAGVFGAANAARGIFTSGGGGISIVAQGDINVDGSRIATLAGGNINVTSVQGDVNAGNGGNGSVTADTVVQLGSNGQLQTFGSTDNAFNTLYGSGIMAVTLQESSAPVGSITVEATQGSINADLGGIQQVAYNHNVPSGAFIDLTAGQNINAGNSGVIGSNVKAKAGGSISGIFIGSGAININAGNNFSGTVVGASEVGITAGGGISGTVIGAGNVALSGQNITADIIGGSVSTAGNSSGATEGFASVASSQPASRSADSVAAAAADGDGTDEEKKKGKRITLARKSSRVTVILPAATR
jgi:filamentous hemagglutinin family protein